MLGERLIRLRKAKKWTQTDLADKCGVSRNSIVNWETEKREPKIGDIQKLAEVLGVSPNDLIGNDNTFIHVKVGSHNHNEEENIMEAENFAYWGGMLDKTRKVIERGDTQEIDLIKHFLKSALSMLTSTNGRAIENAQEAVANVSAYNGDNSTYKGNTLTLGKAIA